MSFRVAMLDVRWARIRMPPELFFALKPFYRKQETPSVFIS
jgi:hypothetical protein